MTHCQIMMSKHLIYRKDCFVVEKNACVRKLLFEELAFFNSAVESVLGTRGICGICDSSPERAVVAFSS